MHLHFGELLLAAFYLAAAFTVLVAIFRTGHIRPRHETPRRLQQPAIKRIAKKREADEDDRKVA